MAAATLNGKSLGSVESISFNKDSNIIPISYPGQDCDFTETFDLLGCTKTISANGIFTGTTTAAVKTLVDDIAAEINGAQLTSVNFVSDQLGTIRVKVASFDVTWEVPSNRARYTLRMIEGA